MSTDSITTMKWKATATYPNRVIIIEFEDFDQSIHNPHGHSYFDFEEWADNLPNPHLLRSLTVEYNNLKENSK